jgi:hypothetical protein
MITELYIGSGPNLLYPGLTEIIRKTSGLNPSIELDSEINISLVSKIHTTLDLRGKIYG